jgi:two-component system, cell cycle sensor histidine kinase and response regulator CckA
MAANLPHIPQDELDRLRFAAIVDSSDDGIVSKDLDGTLRSWNPAAERIFGYTAEEMIGGSIFRLIPPELHDEEHGLLARIRRGEHIAHYETDRIRKDGRRIRVSLTLSPLYDKSGTLIGASAIKRDVTAQRMLEAQLQNALRMEAVGRLAGGVAHDFNNLLTAIGGLAALSLKEANAVGKLRRNLMDITHAVERAGALTHQLLTFGRRQLAPRELLSLNDVVDRLEALLRPLIGEHITLRILVAEDLGMVRSNRAQLEQVVMNLALNARDAMPDGGTLTIQTENVLVNGHFLQEQLRLEPGVYVVISVSDTGQGMDAVTQASIFEPFFTTKKIGEGTGLGLATVYAIVQEAGGAIYVYSEPGHGSVFKVYFPRVVAEGEAPSTVAPGATPSLASDQSSQVPILLVEDEPVVRGFCAEVLEGAGYRVFPAATGEDALVIGAGLDGSLGLLLTDVVLPGMNGRILAERLQTIRPGLPVLYMSGYTDDMVVRTGVVTEGTAFLQKPFTPQGLLDRVQTVLAWAKSRSSAETGL